MSDYVKIGNNYFPILVAVTKIEQARGLMNVESPVPFMAFPFSKAGTRSFWMKDTPSKLDIVFCNKETVVDIKFGEPFSTKYICSSKPSDLVLEFPYGTVEKFNIKVESTVKMFYSIKKVADYYERFYLSKD